MFLALAVFAAIFSLNKNPIISYLSPIPTSQIVASEQEQAVVLSQEKIDLTKRWQNKHVSDGFADNILLALRYLGDKEELVEKNQDIKNSKDIDWDWVRSDFSASFTLEPGEVFAFHKNILAKYEGKAIKTMGSEFVTNQGYKYVAGLGGNGVCHLASLFAWAASEAGLKVEAPTDHSFAKIEGVPRKYWTSIRYKKSGGNSKNQNLYIANDFDFPVRFVFEKRGEELEVGVRKISLDSI